MRIIPKTAKVKIEFFKNISIVDIIIAFLGLGFEILLFLTNIGFVKYLIMVVVLCLFVGLYLPFDGQRFYMFFLNFVKYIFSQKNYTSQIKKASNGINNIISFKNLEDDFIVYNSYYAGVLQIDPREFRLLSGYKQDQIIDVYFSRLVKSISGKTKASIVKIDRKLSFSDFIKDEEAKISMLEKMLNSDEISKEEYLSRVQVLNDRIDIYKSMNGENKLKRPFYYFVVYDTDKNVISEILNNGSYSLLEAGLTSKVLNKKELAIFLKYNFTSNFEENDIDVLHDEEILDWIKPQDIKVATKSVFIDGIETFNFTVKNFPLSVLNAWGYQIFNIPNTKVVMNLEPYEKNKAIRMIDRSLQELSSQSENSFKASSIIDKQTHVQTLVEVLRMLQNDNETLFKVNLHFTIFNTENGKEATRNLKKTIKRILVEDGFELADNFFKQTKAFIASSISAYDPMTNFTRAIHSGTVAAVFPFVLATTMERGGIILGSSGNFPVIENFFKRDNEHVNSNMVIVGKTGSGKSYATKTILTNFASENSKIFILDPENEYKTLAENLNGKIIDVGTASQGRINPFHVITSLDADEDGDNSVIDNFAVHLQFLEEFFHVVLPGLDMQSLDYLNNLIIELYERKHITFGTDFSKLKANDYPIFEDLYNLVKEKLDKAKTEYDTTNLRMILNSVSKFASKGRDSNLWNGESTLSVKECFTVFNFQSLFANKNNLIANAQMLLVLRWLDNEIIKNREFNNKHNTSRKIIVAIDEAHLFIDPKYPIALDFMFQLAKRIRKYNGMQIVITQNIKDFVGSQDIIRKSTAIINACQYSFIFALSPNDMDDLCTLYDKAGKINEIEQEQIINNERGNAFIITSPTSRSNMKIIASDRVKKIFGE